MDTAAPARPDVPGVSPLDRRRVMTRALAFVFFTGGAMKLLWLAIPHAGRADDLGVALCALSAIALGAVLLTLPPRLISDRLLNLAVAEATLEISVALFLTHSPNRDFSFFYLWVIPYAFFFFSLRQAVLQAAWVAVCLAATLSVMEEDGMPGLQWTVRDLSRWVIVLGTIAVVGFLVRRLAGWLRQSEILLRRGYEESPLGMALVSRALRYLDVNEAYARILGRPREEVVGLAYEDVTHPEDFDLVRREAQLVWSDEEPAQQTIEKRIVRPDGAVRAVSCHTTLIRDDHGRPRYLFTQAEDITDRRRLEQERARHAAQQEAVASLGEVALREEDLPDLVGEVVRTATSTLGADWCVLVERSADAKYLADYGGRHGLVGRMPIPPEPWTLTALTMGADRPVHIQDVRDDPRFRPSPLLLELQAVSGVAVSVGGPERPYGALAAFTTRPRRFAEDETRFLQAVANVLADAIQRHRSEEANRHAAVHDPLTGLPNRVLLLDRCEHALRVLSREDSTVAVLVLDLDRFKHINDTLGHAAGDEVLRTVAARLREAIRPEDTAGRLGGDEFAVVCERIGGASNATALADRIMAAIGRPVQLDDGDHLLSTSIGIALTTDPTETPDSLLRDADAALYRAKALGRGRSVVFDERMREDVLGRLHTEAELRVAIAHDDLLVHYQPIVDVVSGRPVSVEALVRWHQPERGVVPPDAFIPIAEETGLISDVGLWVLGTACAQVSAWQHDLGIDLQLAVNASGRQVADPLFPEEVARIAAASGMAPGTLGLEVTESVLIRDAESPLRALSGLRALGLRLLLDDFGTGYSSLTYLKRLAPDGLKVDRSFVGGLGTDPDDSAIVEAVVKLAQTLGLDVVAEGVETDEQLKLLRRLGCHKAQGYLFTPPLPAEELQEFLAAHAMT